MTFRTPARLVSKQKFVIYESDQTWVYDQNGDTETATGMAIFKTATNPNNTYSSSEAYRLIIDRRLYTYIACNC